MSLPTGKNYKISGGTGHPGAVPGAPGPIGVQGVVGSYGVPENPFEILERESLDLKEKYEEMAIENEQLWGRVRHLENVMRIFLDQEEDSKDVHKTEGSVWKGSCAPTYPTRPDPGWSHHSLKVWIGIDLDGTLADEKRPTKHAGIGEPVEVMRERVIGMINKGIRVKIFTARACSPANIPAVKAWCLEYLGQELEITNEKDFEMHSLWDDRAISVERNTGAWTAFPNDGEIEEGQ
jgi:hypothetical protein